MLAGLAMRRQAMGTARGDHIILRMTILYSTEHPDFSFQSGSYCFFTHSSSYILHLSVVDGYVQAARERCLLFPCICCTADFAFTIGSAKPGITLALALGSPSTCSGLLHAVKFFGAGCFLSSHQFQIITLVVLLPQYSISAEGRP